MGFDVVVVTAAAKGNWRSTVFPYFSINVPASKTKHGPCPACGGTDRFRCDDKSGKGTYFCNACGPGDGLSLVSKVRGWDFPETLERVAAIFGLSDSAKVSDADRAKWKREQEIREKFEKEEKERLQGLAAGKAKRIWGSLKNAGSCPYLERKQVKNYGCKINVGKQALVVPLYDVDGNIWNLQTIYPDGSKPYMSDARLNDCFMLIGTVEMVDPVICFVEGYATGASVHEATGLPVAVCFQSSNVDKVAIAMRRKNPAALFVFCMDDDSAASPPDAGIKAGKKAVSATGGIIVLPDFSSLEAA